MRYTLGISCLLLTVAAASGASVRTTDAEDDLIGVLPGTEDLTFSFDQYSGYLDAGNGVMLHYWFTESQNEPENDPLLLWLNGGPGCSSLDGLLTELGPFRIMDDGQTLYENPYSWNTFANVLFLESPACVGFSYQVDGNCSVTASDDSTATANYNALIQFFDRFPNYVENDFYVTGESYAGIYAPTLTLQIIQKANENDINLQGFAIGNPMSDSSMNDDSVLFFANYHGLYDQDDWNNMIQECCSGGIITKENCEFSLSTNSDCSDLVNPLSDLVFDTNTLDVYNLYNPCPQNINSLRVRNMFRRYAQRKGKSVDELLPMKPSSDDPAIPSCPTDALTEAYLNQDDVRQALHIDDSVAGWVVCSDEVSSLWDRTYESVAETHQQIHEAGIRGLIYNGDVDMMCNFIGDQWFVESLEYEKKEDRRPWYINDIVGGWVKQFDLMDLLTVRGSGHMVPKDKPEEALHMIKSFVGQTRY